MLTGCRHICAAWAAIGLLTLATGIAARLGDLARVGAFALVAFATLRVAMATDDFDRFASWLAARRGGTPPPPPAAPRGFWHRPTPYVLLPLMGFVVLVGRALIRPPLGDDARLLILGVMVGALTLAVVYLSLLAAEGVHAGATASSQHGPADGTVLPVRPSSSTDTTVVGALDPSQFARDVLDVNRQGETSRS